MLPFGITPALVVLGVGMVLTAWLCWSGSNRVGAAALPIVRAAGGPTFVMALVVFLIVWVRVG